jgi:hypothetical protein
MNVKVRQTALRTIKPGEPKWLIRDGFLVSPRAGFEISNSCPYEYRMVIDECLRNGWLKPVATVKDNELFWEEFSK